MDGEPIWHAVGTVHHEYLRSGKEPGAEKWTHDTRYYSPQMIADVRQQWIAYTGTDMLFPWHDDWIRKLWTDYRKQTIERKRQFCEFYGIEYRPRT